MKVEITLSIILLLVGIFLPGKSGWAESAMQLGGAGSQARLQFSVTIPTILYLQVGAEGATVDTISFDAVGLPGTGAVEGYSSGAYPVPVRAVAVVAGNQRVQLTADSSRPLTNGTENINFDNIRLRASGDLQNRNFNNRTDQNMRQWIRSGDRRGTYRFFYDNKETHGPGIYQGQVAFTLSLP
ncbi:MAG: hypothetical protein FJ121_06110 [Deltaproteobacteria bacterium]|nr:hypothetical protein [Deltaproteobacteria bacterium]